jgi:hypothetical protein
MFDPRHRFLLLATATLAGIWLLAASGYRLAGEARVTPQKIEALMTRTELGKLAPPKRADVLARLAAMIAALEPAEREAWTRAQMAPGQPGQRWLAQLTGEEKAQLMAATMPRDFQALMQKVRPRRHGHDPDQ